MVIENVIEEARKSCDQVDLDASVHSCMKPSKIPEDDGGDGSFGVTKSRGATGNRRVICNNGKANRDVQGTPRERGNPPRNS